MRKAITLSSVIAIRNGGWLNSENDVCTDTEQECRQATLRGHMERKKFILPRPDCGRDLAFRAQEDQPELWQAGLEISTIVQAFCEETWCSRHACARINSTDGH